MKIVIIGGNGFVGKNVYEILCSRLSSDNVYSFSRKTNFDLLSLNINETQKNILKNVDFIINCAVHSGSMNYISENPADMIDINARMILNLYSLLEKLRTKAIIINPIANCAYPGNLELYREEDFWNGEIHKSVLPFGETKRFLVVLSESYKNQFGIKSINYYVPNMYGEYDSTDTNKTHALNALISKMVEAKNTGKKELVVWGTGAPIREWLYARDFGRIVLETMLRCKNGEQFTETINIGQNNGFSIIELLNNIIPVIGFDGHITYDLSHKDGAFKKVMDNKKFLQRFPDFKFTTFESGVMNTIKYYKSVYPYMKGEKK